MQLTKREMSDGWGRRFLILIGIGLILGWMGPFGTYEFFSPAERFAYWGLSVPLTSLFARFSIRIVVRYAPLAHWPYWTRVAVGSALAGFPGAFVTFTLLNAIHRPFPIEIADLLGNYATVSLVIFLIGYPLALLSRRRLQPVEAVPEPSPSAFFKRLPPKLGTELLSLTAEDHYVRVTTPLGSDLVLIRLSDAIAEIGADKGQRVHRSHWVAEGAVASVDRQSGKTVLVLKNGETIPVSQSYLPALRAAGWL